MKIRKIAVLILGILVLPALAFAKPQVAVLDAILAAGMDKTVSAPITDKIIEELVISSKYTIIDRANVEQVLKEKEFQLSSGVVRNEEVRQAGEYLGADLVVVASVSRVGSTYSISAKMIDVVSGEIIALASSEQKGSIDVVLDVARAVGRQIASQTIAAAESRAQELVQGKTPEKPPVEPAPEQPVIEPPPAEVQPAGGNAAVTMQMQALIKSRAHMKKAGQLQMMGLADQLSDSERLFLYTSNRKDNAVVIMLLNWLVPSLGSWIQGDASGALVELGWLGLGIGGMVGGITTTYDWYYGYYYTNYTALYYIGIGSLVFYVVYYVVRPFTFQRQWNTNLSKSLKTVSLSVLDEEGMTFSVFPTERGPEWKMGLSLVSFEY